MQLRSQFSSTTPWDPGIKLKPSGVPVLKNVYPLGNLAGPSANLLPENYGLSHLGTSTEYKALTSSLTLGGSTQRVRKNVQLAELESFMFS